tara:strand:+ start:3891 stop:5183 length:1293 start_codon:yes stop_codon:yes gene_type:complete
VKNKSLILLELNEVSLKYVERYIQQGKLKNFKKLIKEFGISETHSEKKYENLEPWIQWVTVHTGKSFYEHNIFRLGDRNKNLNNIWDELDKNNINSCLISPMNVFNPNLENSIFIPDPWVNTHSSKGFFIKALHKSISSMVNDNAKQKFKIKDLILFTAAIVRFTDIRKYGKLFYLFFTSFDKPWRKAIFLDLILSNVFLSVYDKKKYLFGSIFLNAAAHIQHHYFYSSDVYDGNQRNPSWYCSKKHDPLFEIYKLYDEILEDFFKKYKESRIILATGLSQEPTQKSKFYWRLKNHQKFLREIGITFQKVEPRMSRDFLVSFDDELTCSNAEKIFISLELKNSNFFEVDNRGKSLFVTLTYHQNISKDDVLTNIDKKLIYPIFKNVSLVALKNGHHNQTGYYLDNNNKNTETVSSFELKNIFKNIISHFD